jgi:hypothetical protein
MESEEHNFDGFGLEKVITTNNFRDPSSNKNFWNTEILYKTEDVAEKAAMIQWPEILMQFICFIQQSTRFRVKQTSN